MWATIWGLHPVLTESVTNIVRRADLLAAFGVLAGLLCYVKAAETNKRRKRAWLTGLAIAQTIGLFSKENAIVLPGLMVLYDLTWPQRASWRDRRPAYAVLAFPVAAFFLLRGAQAAMVIEFSENPLVHVGFWTARLTAVKVIGKFIWLFLWPAHLSADHFYNAVPVFGWQPLQWEDAKALIALAVCVVCLILAFAWRRAHKALCFCILFFFVALAPTSNVFIRIGSIMAERFLYLPSIGLAGCMTIAISVMGRRSTIVATVLCIALVS